MTIKLLNDLKSHNLTLEEDLIQAVTRVIKSGWYALGPEVNAFESEFARYCKAKYCTSVASGTDALELALKACEVGSGDEVITVANAGMYATTAILASGATPVFADINYDDLLISIDSVTSSITPKTRAIIATHLYGQVAQIDTLRDIAQSHGITLIEDCAQAHGAMHNNTPVGSFGDAAAFSFYPTKNLGALGDGGAVITSSSTIHDRLTSLRQYGWKEKYTVSIPGGRNSRLDEIQAAILRTKLPHLDNWNNKRLQVIHTYNNLINHPEVQKPIQGKEGQTGHLYVIKVKERDSLMQHLKEQNIACDVHYPVLDYQQPIFKDNSPYNRLYLPESEKATKEILTLPCHTELSESDIGMISEVINQWKI